MEFADKHKWALDTNVAEVASRRVARRRGVKGFANARDVRTQIASDCLRLPQIASDCLRFPQIAMDGHRLPLIAPDDL